MAKVIEQCVLRHMNMLLLISTVFVLSGCSLLGDQRTENIIKPVGDTRDYRYLQLPNGLKVILVSDMQAEKAAASLDVFAGSAQNPIERPGLAHFLEHMLFLGTQKYPEAGAYQRYISQNGGSHNAYTSFEHTNYFFEVNEPAFEPALDRFAQFFIAPLFDEAYLQREKHAVNAEYKAGIKNEERRQLDVLREVANKKHPFSRFSVGSLDSLSSQKTPIRDDVVDFYQQYYRAGNMTLALLAPESLDQLEQHVRNKFSAVKSGEADKADYAAAMFAPSLLPSVVSIVPEKDRRSLSLLFPLPDQQAFYKDQPLNVIGHVLGHEGKHSNFAYLKKKNWAEGLVAGQGLAYEGITVFSLSIELTQAGLEHKNEILQLIFSQLNTLQKEGIPERLFDELKQVSELEFANQDKRSESSTVTSLANDLHYYEPKELLHAPFSYQQYDQQQIKQLLAYINPRNMLVVDVEPDAFHERQSKYYSTPYAVKPMLEGLVQKLSSQPAINGVHLPDANPFLPSSMALVESTIDDSSDEEHVSLPALIIDEPGIKLWFKGVDRFKQPKLEMNHHFSQAGVTSTAKQTLLMSLYARLLEDAANELLYDANMAGLYASLSSYQSGLNLRTYGFSDKQAYLVPRLLNYYQSVDFSEEQFQRIKLQMQSDLFNTKKTVPYKQLMHAWRAEMQSEVFPFDELLAELTPIRLKDVEVYAAQFWQSVNVQSLINGNMTEQAAIEVTRSVLNIIEPLQTDKVFTDQGVNRVNVKRLSEVDNFWRQYDFNHNDSAYLLYWQAGDDSVKTSALWLLLSNILESAYYHQLRTQEQLGYIVFETYYPLWRVPGLMFVVQSPEAGVERIHQSSLSFLNSLLTRTGLMSDKQLLSYKTALSESINQRPKNLSAETQYYQRSLFYQDQESEIFQRKLTLANAVSAITAADWLSFIQSLTKEQYQRLFLMSSNEGAALDGFIRLNKDLPDEGVYIFPR